MEYNFNWGDVLRLDKDRKALTEASSVQPHSSYPADSLNRAAYAEFLTNFLLTQSTKGYVLNLNSGWGTGKTYFLKRWQAAIANKHATVYIDAWKQDYSDDPMLTVIASITAQLRNQSQDKTEQAIRKIGSKAWGFCKQAAPEITKALIKKASGINVEKITGKEDESEADETFFKSTEFSESAGKVMAAVFKDHEQKLKTIDEFKHSISAFIGAANACSGKVSPTFIFIDELDRCRPSYAVEMLEVIKHFFDMPEVIFVIATDTAQLQHAVKAVYGNGFDAQVYLGRFFQRRCTLKELSRKKFISNKLLLLDKGQTSSFFPNVWPRLNNDIEYFAELISALADIHHLSLRETEQLLDRVIAILSNLKNNSIDLLLLVSLIIIHDKHNELYQWIIANKRPEGAPHDYDVLQSFKKYLNFAELNSELRIRLEIEHLRLDERTIRGDSPFVSGFYPITYHSLLSKQLAMFRAFSKPSITGVRKVSINTKPSSIADIAANELADLEVQYTNYKDWVELATTFEE